MAEKAKKPPSAELLFLAEWCRTLVKCLAGGQQQSQSLVVPLEAAINGAFEKRNFRGMKTAARDLSEWARTLPAVRQSEIDAVLREKLGIGLKEDAAAVAAEVSAILERGRIFNDDEYRLLEAHADAIYADGSTAKELGRINELLAAYGTK